MSRKFLNEDPLVAILKSVRDFAIFMTDENGVVTTWTPGVEHVLGYTEPEFVGQPIAIVFSPEDRAAGVVEMEMENAAREGRAEDRRWHMRKDGSQFWANGVVHPVRADDGTLTGFVKVMRDDTDRKRLEIENKQRAEEAENANRIKDEFLATLSHELRTPLNAILGWAHLVRTGNLQNEDTQRGLETIERNARAQAQLIDDLLDVSRILTGKLRLNLRGVELADIIAASLDAAMPGASAKNLRVESQLDPQASLISGDPERVQQIVWNLLSNAIKFTPRGGTIWVRLKRIDSLVRVEIEDNGQGIAPEFLNHVFDRFRQADSSSTRSHGGLGIGLGLVRHLAELHGATVEVESPGNDQGSTFRVDFPLMAVRTSRTPPDSTPRVTPPANWPQLLADLHVLVVDDEPDARLLVETVLTQHGATLHGSGSVADALVAVKREKFDVLVSDIGMPDENGYALIRQIRSGEESSGQFLPAVALTAYASAEDRMQAHLAGFQVHVPKPIEPAELVAVVASLKGRTGRE
jgi:PAS domain S-box-containing protein